MLVVYDSVNPLPRTRSTWRRSSSSAGSARRGIADLDAAQWPGVLLAHAKDAVLERIETPEEHAAQPEFL